MSPRPSIKTHKDGSIDYAHYVTASHEIRRSDIHLALAAARDVAKTTIKLIKSRLAKFAASGLSKVPDQNTTPTSVFKNL